MNEIKKKDEARQGATGHNVRYVLIVSLALAVIALGIIFAVFA